MSTDGLREAAEFVAEWNAAARERARDRGQLLELDEDDHQEPDPDEAQLLDEVSLW